jgi:hypothetical protein
MCHVTIFIGNLTCEGDESPCHVTQRGGGRGIKSDVTWGGGGGGSKK